MNKKIKIYATMILTLLYQGVAAQELSSTTKHPHIRLVPCLDNEHHCFCIPTQASRAYAAANVLSHQLFHEDVNIHQVPQLEIYLAQRVDARENVGFVAFEQERANQLLIHKLGVDPRMHRKGFGTCILKETESIAQGRKIRYITLSYSTHEAGLFYAKNGYTIKNPSDDMAQNVLIKKLS